MNTCYVNDTLEHRHRSSRGFMGLTHSLSAVALFLCIAAFAPNYMKDLLGSGSIAVILLAMINSVGSSLVPDLDNSASTSKSALGMLGDLLSVIFRTTSEIIQTTVRTSYDKDKPNPHRGFYHTIPGALLVGGIVMLLTQLPGGVTIPGIGHGSWGFAFAIIVSWLNLHMALAGLFKQGMKKVKKQAGPFGEIIAFALSLTIVALIFTQVPTNTNYWWIGAAVIFGMIVHDLGDMFTTAGVPITFPIPYKGKMWWTHRLTGIHAGGVVENYVFIPFFLLISIAAFAAIIGIY